MDAKDGAEGALALGMDAVRRVKSEATGGRRLERPTSGSLLSLGESKLTKVGLSFWKGMSGPDARGERRASTPASAAGASGPTAPDTPAGGSEVRIVRRSISPHIEDIYGEADWDQLRGDGYHAEDGLGTLAVVREQGEDAAAAREAALGSAPRAAGRSSNREQRPSQPPPGDREEQLQWDELKEERRCFERESEEFKRAKCEWEAQQLRAQIEMDKKRLEDEEHLRQLRAHHLEEKRDLSQQREILQSQRQELEHERWAFQELQEQQEQEQELHRFDRCPEEQESLAQQPPAQDLQQGPYCEPDSPGTVLGERLPSRGQWLPLNGHSFVTPAAEHMAVSRGACAMAVNGGAHHAGAVRVQHVETRYIGYSVTTGRAAVEKPIEEWDEEDLIATLSRFSRLPEDLVALLRAHAISGAIFLTLSTEHFKDMGVYKFGHLRLLEVLGQQLRSLLDGRRSPTGTSTASPKSARGPLLPGSPLLSSRSTREPPGAQPPWSARSQVALSPVLRVRSVLEPPPPAAPPPQQAQPQSLRSISPLAPAGPIARWPPVAEPVAPQSPGGAWPQAAAGPPQRLLSTSDLSPRPGAVWAQAPASPTQLVQPPAEPMAAQQPAACRSQAAVAPTGVPLSALNVPFNQRNTLSSGQNASLVRSTQRLGIRESTYNPEENPEHKITRAQSLGLFAGPFPPGPGAGQAWPTVSVASSPRSLSPPAVPTRAWSPCSPRS